MTSKTFVSGTVIDSAWLNDVNGATYNGSAIFTPEGTGAVPTTMQGKIREIVSVGDFGATTADLTGSTNNTAFINALAASDTAFVSPDGTLLVTGNINITGKAIHGRSKYSSIVKLAGVNTNSNIFYNAGSTLTAWGSGGSAQIFDLSLEGNWDGTTANAQTDVSLIGALVQGFGMASVKIQNCDLTYSYGFGLFFYRLGYSDFEDNYIAANGLNGIHLQGVSGGDSITSSSLLNNNINSNGSAGTYPVGASGVYIYDGFSLVLNHNTIESSVNGLTIDGADNRSITLLTNHFEQNSACCINYKGAGTNTLLVGNIFATLPVFIFANAAFSTYTAIGNYQLANSYNLPMIVVAPVQVVASAATPVQTINSITLTPGTWEITAGWIGTNAGGAGQASTRQNYALNFTAALPAYSSGYVGANLQADLVSAVNEFSCAQSSLTMTYTVVSGTQVIYLFGGPQSISSTLTCAITGWIQAVQVNGNYIS